MNNSKNYANANFEFANKAFELKDKMLFATIKKKLYKLQLE